MKREYTKPYLLVETFALNEHISAGCNYPYHDEGLANYLDNRNCNFLLGGMTIFQANMDNNPCDTIYGDGGDILPGDDLSEYHDSYIDLSIVFSS